MSTTTQKWKDDLMELIADYFSIGVAEGREGRDHDAKDGVAQARLISIMAMLEKQPYPELPQDVEQWLDNDWCRPHECGVAEHVIDVASIRRFLSAWMTGHVRVPVEVLESAASALIPLANAAMPVEREMLTDEHNEAAHSAIYDKLAPYLADSEDWSWLNASKGE